MSSILSSFLLAQLQILDESRVDAFHQRQVGPIFEFLSLSFSWWTVALEAKWYQVVEHDKTAPPASYKSPLPNYRSWPQTANAKKLKPWQQRTKAFNRRENNGEFK